MSERTLRRRLRESGVTYGALVDAVRSERAIALADQGEHSVTAIAQLSGFADATAFAPRVPALDRFGAAGLSTSRAAMSLAAPATEIGRQNRLRSRSVR